MHTAQYAALKEPLTLTVKQTRGTLNVGNTTVWKLIKEGKLTAVKVAGRTLITYASVKALVTPQHADAA
ncbi:excisionase family DNA-binding protein [Roseomonas sp. CECT 9278]|uniref:excisionase family DNA-binding protein n=1 Tax=Roseomonas sp. CECT 9278 TaxID=2845823 RepID=UPI001E3D72F1|nr:excisionase family DNA-binding protein [Roseomonas sp. CECT 9278]CAH0161746.1 hypothetical protein ROS9278_00978 [Roseomonas sp. CECT 9278]